MLISMLEMKECPPKNGDPQDDSGAFLLFFRGSISTFSVYKYHNKQS